MTTNSEGWDRVVGIGIRYGLDGPEIKSWWGRVFPHPSILMYNGNRVFAGRKAAGAWHWPLTPSNVEVKERVELFIYSLSGTAWSF
jgi:hypothetical protein